MPKKKNNKTLTGNDASSFLQEADKNNTIVTRSSTKVGPSTVRKNTQEISIQMPEGKEEESVENAEGEDDEQATQETEGDLNNKEITLVKSLRKMQLKPPKHFDRTKD